MAPYDRLKQAVRDGDTTTALFLLAWLDGAITTQDREQGTNHVDTVNTILDAAFRSLDTHPEAVA